jgi:pimeloyl-ACP methyl ester carboxylesterase
MKEMLLVLGFILLSLSPLNDCKILQQEPNITTIIAGYGYPLEVHVAVTSDGYELILHRIPHGRNVPATKGPVLLQHGLTDASAGWCLNPPDESLAYILADSGYDVWLGNNRGNGYSMSNVNYGPNTQAFWDFSWDELALIDFPTLINYVSTTTQSPKISYIGHSEGTIQAFAGLISNPSLADKLHVFIALAPVTYVGGITVSLFQILSHLDADDLLALLGLREFFLPDLVHILLPDICKVSPSTCGFGGTVFYGSDSFVNITRLDFYTDYEPFPTSAKNIIHWSQCVRDNTFAKYDYGLAGNLLHYGQITPPPYPIKDFPATLPLVLFTGGIDGLADPSDVAKLLKDLPVNHTVINIPNYGHLDPLLGYNAHQIIYPTILEQLVKYYKQEELIF